MTSIDSLSGERRFQALIENARDLIAVLGPERTVEYVSPSVERVLGFLPEEKVDASPLEEIHPDDRERAAEGMEALFAGQGAQWSGRLRARHKDGSWRTLDVVGQDLMDDPQVRGVVVNAWDVTELARAEAALRAREELLSSVVANVPMIISALDGQGRFTLSEGRGLRTVGLKPGEVVGVSALKMYRDDPEILSDIRRAMAGESFRTRRSWAGRIFQSWWSPLGGGAGTLSVALDITDRARAREEQERLLAIIDATPDFVGIASADMEVQHVNPAGRRMTGVDAEADVHGWPVFRFHPQWAMDLLVEEAIPTIREEGVWQGESALRGADGSEIPVWQVLVAHRSSGGEVEFLSTVCSDLTERRRAQEQIRFQAHLLDAVGQAVVATDAEGRISYWNRAAERLHGWTPEEALGRDALTVTVAPRRRDRAMEILEGLEAGESWTGELILRRKGGEEFPALTTAAPIRDRDGELEGFVGVSTDLTRQKHLEEELREAQKMEAVGRLAGGIAHDFNNLLTAIQGHVELLRRDLDPGSELQDDLGEIQGAARRAAELTRQLLAFGRRQTFLERVVDLGEEVGEMRTMLRRLIPQSISLEVDLPEERALVRADPTQVHQVLLNLALNAVDAMPSGGRLQVGVDRLAEGAEGTGPEGVAPGPWVRLRVEDDGVGMAPEVVARIFEPFFTTKEVGKGTGLGLSTVFGIVKQSGGEVAVESEPGGGTRMHVLLPPAKEGEAPEPRPGHPEQAAAEELPGGTETVLVVEDDDSVRSFTTRTLRRAGYRVLQAPDGRQALELARDHPVPVDLVLSDVVMPTMGGPELTRRLREIHEDVRVILTSGYARDELPSGPEELSVPFLPKPFDGAELLEAVREALEG